MKYIFLGKIDPNSDVIARVILKNRKTKKKVTFEPIVHNNSLFVEARNLKLGFYNVFVQHDNAGKRERFGQHLYKDIGSHRKRVYHITSISESKHIIPYLTYPGTGLSIYVSHSKDYFHRILGFRKPPTVTQVIQEGRSLAIVGELDFAMELDLDYQVKLILKKRGENSELELDCKVTPLATYKISKEGAELSGHISFQSDIDVDQLVREGWLSSRFLDVRVRLKSIEGRFYERRLGDSENHMLNISGDDIAVYGFKNIEVYPYFTRSSMRGLSIMYRDKQPADSKWSEIKENIALKMSDWQWVRNRFDGWVLYEHNSKTAQDNAYYFFKWLQKHHPEVKAKFILDRNAKDYSLIKEAGVVPYYSLRHLLLMLNASILVSSQSRFHGYKYRPLRSKFRKAVVEKPNMFLQHGVLGIKKTSAFNKLYFQDAPDAITVSNRREVDIVRKWGYDDSDIALVGLTRFDYLQDASKKGEKDILVMPTWRPWLEGISKERFMESEFYVNYLNLVDKLSRLPDVRVTLYVHSKMGEFISCFSHIDNLDVVQVGETKVNKLLMQANLLITDYSSVAWDFYKMGKQVVFYGYDYEKYQGYVGFYSDLKNDLFGRFFDDSNAIVEYVDVTDSFVCDVEDSFFEFDDKNACQRTYEYIRQKFPSDNG